MSVTQQSLRYKYKNLYWSSSAFGNPEEFVDKKKRLLMKRAADEFIHQQKLDAEIRFDIVSVSSEKGELKIYHIQDAFFNEEDEKYNWWDCFAEPRNDKTLSAAYAL